MTAEEFEEERRREFRQAQEAWRLAYYGPREAEPPLSVRDCVAIDRAVRRYRRRLEADTGPVFHVPARRAA